MAEFDVGNVYSVSANNNKAFYIAIKKQTLAIVKDGKFCQYTTRKKNHVLENLSVKDLCKHWNIDIKEFDKHLHRHFAPDPRGRKSLVSDVSEED